MQFSRHEVVVVKWLGSVGTWML